MRSRATVIVDIITFISDIWYWIAQLFYYISDIAGDIPFVGSDLKLFFLLVARTFFEWYDYDEGIPIKTCLYAKTIDLGFWLLDVSNAIDTILPWSAIQAKIKEWLTDIETLVYWFSDWFKNVKWAIDSWWLDTKLTVQGLIDTAVEGLANLLTIWNNFWTIIWPEWTGKLNTIKSEWDYFWIEVYPALVDVKWAWEWWKDRAKEVGELIDSDLQLFLPFRDDLVSLWGDIKDFFSDPLQWIYDKLDEWFERFW